MTPDMIAQLAAGRASLTFLFRLDLPDAPRHLLLGSTEVMWGADKFVGFDPTFGSISTPDDITEDMTGQAPNTSIVINPAQGVDRDVIAGEDVQLAPFKAWLAALTKDAFGRVVLVPDPELEFDGFIDQATINLDRGRDDIDFTIISAFDYFFEDSEGERLNGQFHKSIWPGETGLDNVTGITKKIYWGMNAPPNSSSSSSSIYGGAGGGSGSQYGGQVHSV
jgi:hypothetical protein